MREGWRQTTLGGLLRRRNARLGEAPEPRILTVTEGHGLVDQVEHWGRRVATADVSKYKVVEPDDVVYNVYLLWKGAIGQNLYPERGVTSPVYEVFAPREEVAPRLLGLIVQSPQMIDAFDAISIGTIPRRRRAPWQDFLRVPVRVPPLDEQRRIVDLIGALDDTIAAADTGYTHLLTATELMRDADFSPVIDVSVTLDQLCSVDGSLVDPTGALAELPHVGAERIVSGTGDLVGVVSAREDGVTSGKYRFDDRHVIYSKIRPNLRKVALPGGLGLCSADAYPLLGRDGIPRRYLQQLLLSRAFTEAATSRSGRTKMPKINRTELMSIEVRSHSVEEMAGLADKYDALTEARQALLRHTTSLGDLRSNLLTALLSGEHPIPEAYDELMEELAA